MPLCPSLLLCADKGMFAIRLCCYGLLLCADKGVFESFCSSPIQGPYPLLDDLLLQQQQVLG